MAYEDASHLTKLTHEGATDFKVHAIQVNGPPLTPGNGTGGGPLESGADGLVFPGRIDGECEYSG